MLGTGKILLIVSLQEMLKKYSNGIETGKKKKKKKKKSDTSNLIEWVDTSYIKKYTSQDELKELLESIESKYPNIAER